jgi:DNA-binding response OmpR family regulator
MKTPGRILVVDDDRHIAFFLKHVLERAGYCVQGVESGERVSSALQEFEPAAVILDVDLPGKSGVQICRAIRADPAHENLVVVFSTSHSFDASGEDMRTAGANWTFPKPISPTNLLNKLRELQVLPA